MFKKISLAVITQILFLSAPSQAISVINLAPERAEIELTRLTQQLEKDKNSALIHKDIGIILHQQNRLNMRKERVYESIKHLNQASKMQPKDYETLAWLGSAVTMKAAFETDPGRQTLFVKLGTRKMDSAIKKAPDNKVIRLTRAYNSLEIPPFLKRTRFAVEDLNHFFSLCEKDVCDEKELIKAKEALITANNILTR